MKHLILIIAILTGSAQVFAQAQQSSHCLELKKVKVSNHVLHQWGETSAELRFQARNCQVVDAPQRASIVWETQPGLKAEVTSVGLEEIDQQSAHQTPFMAGKMTITVKLDAVDPPVGEHELRGTVTYQAVNSAGVTATESLPISMQFKVGPPKQPEKKNEFVEGLKTTGEVVAGVALLPVFLIVTLVYCPISGECPTC
jgi:hypothetical protein